MFCRFFLYIVFIFLVFTNSNIASARIDNEAYTSNGNYQSHKYSELDQINSKNVATLNQSWIYKTQSYDFNLNKNNQTIPVFTGNSLGVISTSNYFISLNPVNGIENCKIKIPALIGKRGISYASLKIADSVFENIFFIPTIKGVYSINENNCKIEERLGNKGIFGKKNSLVAPIIQGNKIFIAFKNEIESFEIFTGKKNWSLNFTGARIWSGFSFDEKSNTLAVVTSNPEGKNNPAADIINIQSNKYSNSLILVDAIEGKIKCNFQDTKFDHWDLDMVGPPIIISKSKDKNLAYGFSKNGNIIILDVNTCALENRDNFKKILVENFDKSIPNYNHSTYQEVLSDEYRLYTTRYELNEYINSLENKKEKDYIKHITRHSKSGYEFIPLSINYDVIMYGIHGGPQWPGGSYDKKNNQLIIPINNYPWFLRTFYEDRLYNKISNYEKITKNTLTKNFKNVELTEPKAPWEEFNKKNDEPYFTNFFYDLGHSFIDGNIIYKQKCQSCHNISRQAYIENESQGGSYISSLINIELTGKVKSLENIIVFNNAHKYSINNEIIQEKELSEVKNFLIKLDKFFNIFNLYKLNARWQLFLDFNNLHATNFPWGKIVAVNLLTNKINYSIPFGYRYFNGKKILGDINFGGILSTNGNIFFATGTPDKKIRAYNSSDGEELWSFTLPSTGTASPMTYMYQGKQYIIVNTSRGKYFGYDNDKENLIIAFSLH